MLFAGCSKSYSDNSDSYLLPEGLKHCKVYRLNGDSGSRDVTVVHCPNSSTTTEYSCGKGCYHSNTVIQE